MPMMDAAWACGAMGAIGLAGLAGLLLVAALTAGLIWLARIVWDWSGRTHLPAAGEPPLDVRPRRYAAGELTREDFGRMRDELGTTG